MEGIEWMRRARAVGCGIGKRVAKFIAAAGGNLTTVLALAAVPTVGAVGVATDSALAFLVKTRMQSALDAAGLAAGRAVFSEFVETDAEQYFRANFPDGYLDSTVTSFTPLIDAAQETITLTAAATVDTHFMRLFGHDHLAVSARAVIQRENRGMELALVMDNTGSMRSGGKMTAMKDAARELIDIIYGGNETLEDVWVALVPYTAAVNIGPQHADWLSPGDRVFDAADPFAPANWKGCVEARTAPLDESDAPPAAAAFASFYYASAVDNLWPPLDESNGAQNEGTGPNLGCGPAITPLTAEKTTILAAIAEMLPWHRGGTTSNLGLVWGWRTLSPQWRGLWGGATPAALPLDYDTPLMDKVVVLLTDGQNQFFDWRDHAPNGGVGPGGSDYTAYGRLNEFGFATLGAARAEIDNRLARICAAMKAQGIEIFAITFGPTPDTATQNLYRACASRTSNYFHAPSNDEMRDAFQTIGRILSNLRIAE